MSERKKHFMITPLFAMLGRAGGLVIPFLVAYYYGAGRESDAFFFAFALIFSLLGLFVPVFESLLLPYLSEVGQSKEEVTGFSNSVLIVNLPLILAVGAGLWWCLAPLLERFSGLDAQTSELTASLFAQMLPMFVIGVMTAAGNSIFYNQKIFWFPAFSPFIRSVWVIGFIFAGHSNFGIRAAAIGFSLGELCRWSIGLILLVKGIGWRLSVRLQKYKARITDFMKQAGYHLLALLALNLIPLTDQWFASWLNVGSLSLVSYADRLFQIPFQLMMTGFLQIFLSFWSDHYYQESKQVFWERVWKDIRIVFAVTAAFSAVLILTRGWIVRLLFGWGGGAMPEDQLQVLAGLFGWLMAGFAPAILNLLYVRVLFVMKKSSVFLVQSVIRLVLNIVFNWIMMKLWGIQGLAIATAGVFTATTLWLHFYLRREYLKMKGSMG